LASGEPLRLRAIVIAPLAAPPSAVTLFYAKSNLDKMYKACC